MFTQQNRCITTHINIPKYASLREGHLSVDFVKGQGTYSCDVGGVLSARLDKTADF
jgi:hypothetical protein